MTTFLRRALPTVLVAGGLALAVAGVLMGTGARMVPSALLLGITGAAAAVYLHLNRPRQAAPVLRVVPPARSVPAVPTQRSAPHCVIPAPRPAPDAAPAQGPSSSGSAARWSATRASGTGRGGVRHCVLPRGALPHQRRATDGS